VHDSGIGIPPDKLSAIFREFERLGQGRETGIGLGLAIVERSAPLVGGTVMVQSVVGRGSCFAITLPMVMEGAGMVPALAPPTSAIAPRRLLVVDDDPANRDAMRAVLEGLGHDCVTAAAEADAMADGGPFDGALVDFHLGSGGDGIDLIDRLRVRKPDLPVALVTAERGQGMLDRAKAREVAVLAKPLGVVALNQWITARTQPIG
jgi:CheY-like chemotaxis protein